MTNMDIYKYGKKTQFTKETAKIYGSKGGKVSNASLWNKVSKRKKCSKKCPIYDRCPFASASLSDKNPDKSCLLNKWNKQYAKGLVHMLEGNEDGIDHTIQILMNMLYAEILTKYKDNIKEKRGLLKDVLEVRKTIFGEKKSIKVKGDMNINMEEILKKIKEEVK